MRVSIVAALFATGALSTLVKKDCNDTCMTYEQASVVANNFASLISAYTDANANAYLSSDFMDYSDSVTTLIDSGCQAPLPLGQVTFPNRAAFEAGQGSQPNITFIIEKLWYACTGPVVIRWNTPNSLSPGASVAAPETVRGNIILETTRGSDPAQPWLVKTTYSEFNSGAWLVDLAVFKPNCSASKTRRSVPRIGRIA